jgi:fibronectin type III domain protein
MRRTLLVGLMAGSVMLAAGVQDAPAASAAPRSAGTTGSNSAPTFSSFDPVTSPLSYTIREDSPAAPGPSSGNTFHNPLPVTKKGVPGKCTHVLISSSETTVTLYWKPPTKKNGGATVRGYRVSIGGGGIKRTAVVKSSVRAFTFKGLTPDTLYTASVRARNSKGEGRAVSLDVKTLVQVRAQAH